MATVTTNLNPAGPQIFIDAPTIRSVLPYKSLINHLQTSLASATSVIQSPIRHSHPTSSSSTLLLMPAWSLSSTVLPYIGVKLVTTHPDNSSLNLPGVHASYVLFNSVTGQTLASFDGTEITVRRTACVSAVASHYLSNPSSQVIVVLLMIGAGSLAPHLIKAHLTTRPSVSHVMIWNRTSRKSETLVEEMKKESGMESVRFEVCEDIEPAVNKADIVTCATNSESPLVLGKWLKAGAHLDLVGSYKPSMRECDDEAMKRGRVFIDNEAAVVEAGELVGAFERGVMKKEEVEGDLVELIKGVKIGRKDEKEVTVFVSVGSAVVDLLSAQLAYETVVKP
ncbi:putative thiomorpholine-carboxylate dehydrogenase [Helianthus annuus]|uniref:Thiomorpholine-carboxylate dehydrogenase n=1 Tax=Helianthus annuus TaxID=4232 RepID=A0A9K3IP34_HELAN|nr:putative thiomorpholine-carboxylate dehydrogenase [Helianthus annuus]KAJ0551818.1 putative thiomorpholine-carboxylate dehydrogenase [Helianthus annuus]KAJ0732817.1 putative thiomorpholine-carboxylate dehydrogenase [Helianthus annuus]